MLILSSVSKHFGGLQVLQNVNLTVGERGIIGLIGPNGAGKTTLFNLITGLLPLNDGSIEFLGHRLDGLPPYRIARYGIARTFQNVRIFKEMSLLENVLVAAASQYRYSAAEVLLPFRRFSGATAEASRARALLAQVGLADRAHLPGGAISYGEQRRLEIARALATRPKLLLLDEPAAGMNTAEKQQLMQEIVRLHEGGLGVLIIEHDMRFIMGLCERIVVLNFGRVIAEGAPAEVRGDPEVIAAYLGRDSDAVAASPS